MLIDRVEDFEVIRAKDLCTFGLGHSWEVTRSS